MSACYPARRLTWSPIPPRWRRLAGTYALLLTAWLAMHGQLWAYEPSDAHRFTSRAMLAGGLQLRSVVALVRHDEQVHDGAVYTNWGFGVPLLQMPFHALAWGARLLHGFFPDRAIFFVYLAAALPAFWAASDRLLEMRGPPATSTAHRQLASWALTWLVLNWALFPFLSSRFAVYEETLAYATICQLLALSGYVLALRSSWSTRAVAAMGVAAGLGLLVRSTGLLYVGVWGSLVAVGGPRRQALRYALVVAPFVAFFLYTNHVRAGSLLGLGYENSNPAWEHELPVLRFGSVCADSALHATQAAARLFAALFFYVPHDSGSGWLRACHFDLEERDGTGEPYLGPVVLAMLVWFVVSLLRRRERRLAPWLPYAAMAALFAAFVRRGDGFAWRYVGDFWPLVLLAAVQHVRALPPGCARPLDGRTVHVFLWGGLLALAHFLAPWPASPDRRNGGGPAEVLPTSDAARMERDFRASHSGPGEPLPSRVACGDRMATPFDNGLGWREGCRVATFTNVYLGVPPGETDRHVLRVRTEGMAPPSVRVYVNGTVYTAEKRGDEYDVDVVIPRRALASPVVVATVQWTRGPDPPPGRMLSIELV